MIEKGLRELILAELDGRLWHTTHPDRFKGILISGAFASGALLFPKQQSLALAS